MKTNLNSHTKKLQTRGSWNQTGSIGRHNYTSWSPLLPLFLWPSLLYKFIHTGCFPPNRTKRNDIIQHLKGPQWLQKQFQNPLQLRFFLFSIRDIWLRDLDTANTWKYVKNRKKSVNCEQISRPSLLFFYAISKPIELESCAWSWIEDFFI